MFKYLAAACVATVQAKLSVDSENRLLRDEQGRPTVLPGVTVDEDELKDLTRAAEDLLN